MRTLDPAGALPSSLTILISLCPSFYRVASPSNKSSRGKSYQLSYENPPAGPPFPPSLPLTVLILPSIILQDCITQYISQDRLNISSEYEVYEALIRWVQRNEEERKKELSTRLRLVRLGLPGIINFLNAIL